MNSRPSLRDVGRALEPPRRLCPGFDGSGDLLHLITRPGCSSEHLPVILVENGPGAAALINAMGAQLHALRSWSVYDEGVLSRCSSPDNETQRASPFRARFHDGPPSDHPVLVDSWCLTVIRIDRNDTRSFIQQHGDCELHCFSVPGQAAFEYTCPDPSNGTVRLPGRSGIIYPPASG